MGWLSGPGLHGEEVRALTPGLALRPPQELAEAQAGLQAQAGELCRAQERQEELLQRLREAQEREAATASQTQALSSRLEEAQDTSRSVSDGDGRGRQESTAPCELQCGRWGPREPSAQCWPHHVPPRPHWGWLRPE